MLTLVSVSTGYLSSGIRAISRRYQMNQTIRDIIDATTDKEVLTDISDAALDRIEDLYKEEHSLSRYIKDRIGLDIPFDTNLIHGPLSNLLVYGHSYIPYNMAVELCDHISDSSYDGGPLCD